MHQHYHVDQAGKVGSRAISLYQCNTNYKEMAAALEGKAALVEGRTVFGLKDLQHQREYQGGQEETCVRQVSAMMFLKGQQCSAYSGLKNCCNVWTF